MYKSICTNLMVESVGNTIEFYTKTLGFSVIVTVPEQGEELQFAILSKDELTIMLQQRQNLIAEYPILSVTKTQPSVTLYIKVDNLFDLYDRLKDSCEILATPHKTFYGNSEFAIADNNGYVLTFSD